MRDLSTRLWDLQTEYDLLVERRGTVILKYDNAPDGSIKKALAKAELEQLGAKINKVERALGALADSLGIDYEPPDNVRGAKR